jgi:hypothetical protein
MSFRRASRQDLTAHCGSPKAAFDNHIQAVFLAIKSAGSRRLVLSRNSRSPRPDVNLRE